MKIKIYLKPHKQIYLDGAAVLGWYDVDKDKVCVLYDPSPALMAHVLYHEMGHALTRDVKASGYTYELRANLMAARLMGKQKFIKGLKQYWPSERAYYPDGIYKYPSCAECIAYINRYLR